MSEAPLRLGRLGLWNAESNKGNPAARAYIGTSAAAERGMVTWIMRLNMRGMEGASYVKSICIFHGFQVVRSQLSNMSSH